VRPDAGVRLQVTPVPREDVTLGGRTYRAYRQEGDTFRIVCEEPCPIDEQYLFARYAGFREAKQELITLTGVDVHPRLTPVDIHLTGDSLCGAYQPFVVAGMAFPNITNGVWGPGANVCLWEYENASAPPPFIPVPLTLELALAREQQGLAVHEYAHVILYLRHELSYEWVVRALSYKVVRAAQGLCDEMNALYATTAYELCRRNGMGYEDFAPALREVDRLYQAGLGRQLDYYGEPLRTTSSAQLFRVLDGITGGDTLGACVAGGELTVQQCGDDAVLPPGGGAVTMYDGGITWTLPNGAVSEPLEVSAATWRLGMPVAEPWTSFLWAHNFGFEPAERPFSQPVRMTVHYDPALIPDGGSESSLVLWEMRTNFWPPTILPGSTVDTARNTVSANVWRVNRFIVAPTPTDGGPLP
jgi:hypothetical protein